MSSLSSNAALTFVSSPTSLEDPPAPIARICQEAHTFVEVYDWLFAARNDLAELDEIGHADADGRLGSLLCRIHDQLEELRHQQMDWWEMEKVKAGLYGLHSSHLKGPVMMTTGKQSHFSFVSYL